MKEDFHKTHNPMTLFIVLTLTLVAGFGLIAMSDSLVSDTKVITGNVVNTPVVSDLYGCEREYTRHMKYCGEAFEEYFDMNICEMTAEKNCLYCVLETGTKDEAVFSKFCE